jgi:hypothetical protein
MKKIFIAFLLSLSVTLSAQYAGDTLSPMRVVEKYLSPLGFPEKMRHFCCEMYQEWSAPKTLGEQLAVTVQRDFQLLYQDTARAVVTVWLHDSVTSMDVYFYLQHRTVWTVYAVRSLVMKDFAANDIKRLDSIPLDQRGSAYTKKSGHTWQFDYDNAKLWGKPDTTLATYFYEHRAAFAKLEKYRAKKYPLKADDSVYVNVMLNKKIRKQTDKLLIRDIIVDKHAPGTVLYLIGGVLDNSVGYMYQPDPAKVPAVTAGYFILIRPLGNGWYLYKTT